MIKPASVIRQLRRPPRWEGWIPTHTGTGFYLIDPKPEDVRLDDIARGLAFKYRYGGQIEPITVAEHSVLVSRITEILWPQAKQALAALMHDACEAYTHDIQAPVRRFIKIAMPNGEQITWGDLERKINQAIAKALGMNTRFYAAPEVKAADLLALCLEKDQCSSIRSLNWGLPPIPDEIKDIKLSFYPPETAQTIFLDHYQALLQV